MLVMKVCGTANHIYNVVIMMCSCVDDFECLDHNTQITK
jgi:hypothetical protein